MSYRTGIRKTTLANPLDDAPWNTLLDDYLLQYTTHPDTSTWGAAEKGKLWFNLTENKYYYWNGTAKVPFPSEAGAGAGTDLSFVTISSEPTLSSETLHKDITGVNLHIPKVHTHIQTEITDLVHDATKIKGVTVDDADKADGKVLAYNAATQKLEYESGASYEDADAIAAVEGEATLDLQGEVTLAAGKKLKTDVLYLNPAGDPASTEGFLSYNSAIDRLKFRDNAAVRGIPTVVSKFPLMAMGKVNGRVVGGVGISAAHGLGGTPQLVLGFVWGSQPYACAGYADATNVYLFPSSTAKVDVSWIAILYS